MHFVDLAGSERVCKTGVKGLQLSEAKYINLSLHYLEGVIIALHQDAVSAGRIHAQTAPPGVSKSWANSPLSKRPYSAADLSGKPRHIPYRNSLLTMLLKDSLGKGYEPFLCPKFHCNEPHCENQQLHRQ